MSNFKYIRNIIFLRCITMNEWVLFRFDNRLYNVIHSKNVNEKIHSDRFFDTNSCVTIICETFLGRGKKFPEGFGDEELRPIGYRIGTDIAFIYIRIIFIYFR